MPGSPKISSSLPAQEATKVANFTDELKPVVEAQDLNQPCNEIQDSSFAKLRDTIDQLPNNVTKDLEELDRPQVMIAIFDYDIASEGELGLRKNDKIYTLHTSKEDGGEWLYGLNVSSQQFGIFPRSYCSPIDSDFQQEFHFEHKFNEPGIDTDSKLSDKLSSNSLKFSKNSERSGFQEQMESSGSKKEQENNANAESFFDASHNRNSDSSFSENLQTFKDSLQKISDELENLRYELDDQNTSNNAKHQQMNFIFSARMDSIEARISDIESPENSKQNEKRHWICF